MNIIKTENLGKRIKDNVIYHDINLRMESGQVYGFVGANGSGKTMLFRTLAGLIQPSEGRILLNEQEYVPFKDRILSTGIVIENMNLYPDMTGFQNLKCLSKINRTITDSHIHDAIAAVGLDPDDRRKVGKYSLGMRQKIVLAQAIMEKPSFLLLDEPTNGLDEDSVIKIHTILLELAGEGSIVAIASHNKEHIEKICNTTYYFQQGTVYERQKDTI